MIQSSLNAETKEIPKTNLELWSYRTQVYHNSHATITRLEMH